MNIRRALPMTLKGLLLVTLVLALCGPVEIVSTAQQTQRPPTPANIQLLFTSLMFASALGIMVYLTRNDSTPIEELPDAEYLLTGCFECNGLYHSKVQELASGRRLAVISPKKLPDEFRMSSGTVFLQNEPTHRIKR